MSREECKKLSAELECDYEEPDKDLTVLKKEKLLRTQVHYCIRYIKMSNLQILPS